MRTSASEGVTRTQFFVDFFLDLSQAPTKPILVQSTKGFFISYFTKSNQNCQTTLFQHPFSFRVCVTFSYSHTHRHKHKWNTMKNKEKCICFFFALVCHSHLTPHSLTLSHLIPRSVPHFICLCVRCVCLCMCVCS